MTGQAVAVDPRVGGKSARVVGRVAIYCRISRDGDGRGLGVERQREDCLRLAALLGLHVDPADIIVENDMSASSLSTKPRPLWNALLERVRSGEVTHVIAYSLSRLTRRMGEREELLDLRAAGASMTTVLGQRIAPDMSAMEVQMLRMAGVNDTAESDIISERVRRAHEQNAQRGTPHGAVAYGWDRGRDTAGNAVDILNEAQAAVLREVAHRVLNAESFAAIVRDLNERGVPAPKGGTWKATTLRRMMLRERNAGRRMFQGRVVGAAQWSPIYSDQTHDAVVAYLTDPSRVTNRGAQRHLLSGLLTCGKCGSSRMYVHTTQTPVGYGCRDCHGVRRTQTDLDLFVSEAVIARVAQPDALDWLSDDAGALDAARQNLAGLRGQADLLADMVGSGDMTRDQFVRANVRLQEQIAAAEAAIATLRPLPEAVRTLVGHGSIVATRAAWEELTIGAKREAIRTLATVVVLPRNRRRSMTTADAVVFDWKTTPDAA